MAWGPMTIAIGPTYVKSLSGEFAKLVRLPKVPSSAVWDGRLSSPLLRLHLYLLCCIKVVGSQEHIAGEAVCS